MKLFDQLLVCPRSGPVSASGKRRFRHPPMRYGCGGEYHGFFSGTNAHQTAETPAKNRQTKASKTSSLILLKTCPLNMKNPPTLSGASNLFAETRTQRRQRKLHTTPENLCLKLQSFLHGLTDSCQDDVSTAILCGFSIWLPRLQFPAFGGTTQLLYSHRTRIKNKFVPISCSKQLAPTSMSCTCLDFRSQALTISCVLACATSLTGSSVLGCATSAMLQGRDSKERNSEGVGWWKSSNLDS